MSSLIEDPEIPLVGMNSHKCRSYSSTYNEDVKGASNSIASIRRYGTVGKRLAIRRELFEKRRRLGDVSLLLAACGIVLMMIELELCLSSVIDKTSSTSFFVKLCITITTIVLLVVLGLYHRVDIKLFTIDNCVDDWCLAIDRTRVLKIGLELLICCVHPIPGTYTNVPFTTSPPQMTPAAAVAPGAAVAAAAAAAAAADATTPSPLSAALYPFSAHAAPTTPVLSLEKPSPAASTLISPSPAPSSSSFLIPTYDVFLALPMFLRVYLLCRSIMLHSRLYEDASSQSLGALNRIHFNFAFIFKSFMSLHSDYVLIMITITAFLISSWCLRLCEIQFRPTEATMLNSMWLIAVTFLSVGYGDIVPVSYCGRAIAVITGIIGAGCTALVVAVLARKLELTRAEKYVHDFVIDADLNKRIKHEAANVLRAGWLIYKANKNHASKRAVNEHQRKMLRAIYNIRERKAQQRRLLDSTVTLVEVNKGQSDMSVNIDQLRSKQQAMEEQIYSIRKAVLGVHEKLDKLYHVLNKSPS